MRSVVPFTPCADKAGLQDENNIFIPAEKGFELLNVLEQDLLFRLLDNLGGIFLGIPVGKTH